MQTINASKAVINEIDNLISVLSDDIAGLHGAGDPVSIKAKGDKIALVRKLNDAKAALEEVPSSHKEWQDGILQP